MSCDEFRVQLEAANESRSKLMDEIERLTRDREMPNDPKPAADLTENEVEKLFERIAKRRKAEGQLVPIPDQIMKAFLDPTGYDRQFEQVQSAKSPPPSSEERPMPNDEHAMRDGKCEECGVIGISPDGPCPLPHPFTLSPKEREELADVLLQAAVEADGFDQQVADLRRSWSRRLREGE